MPAINPLTSLLALAESPTGLDVIEAFGHFLTTLAAHNKQHLGTSDGAVANAGALIETLGAFAGASAEPAAAAA